MSLSLVPSPAPDDGAQQIRDRITDAENYRRPFELTWLSNLAFVAGQQWLVAPRGGSSRTLAHISEVDPAYAERDLYTADVIKEQRGAALGELQADTDRPQLLLPGDGEEDKSDESIQNQLNRAVGHCWEYEVLGDEKLMDARSKAVDMGVSAIRCRFDPSQGNQMKDQTGQPLQAPVHHATGQPITNAEQARTYVAERAAQGAPPVQFKQLNEGRICWEVGSAFNILAPAGVPHEKDFPWEVWVRAVPLDTVKDTYGSKAQALSADADIQSALGFGVRQSQQTDGNLNAPGQGKLKDHVWLYTYFEKPTAKYPNGRVVELAGGAKNFLRETPSLPYKTVDGQWRSGISYFHWWRLNDRFYSSSLIEGLKDPQRMINRRKTQMVEIIDRSMPYMLVEEDTLPQKPRGTPMEFVELKKSSTVQPQVVAPLAQLALGTMQADVEALREDLAHASTLSILKLGESPPNVNTYSGLALLQEQEQAKRATIRVEQQHAIKHLVEDVVYDIRRYWPEEKQILVSGKENELQASLFKKEQIPDLYIVRPASGSAKPRGQGAMLQLVSDIWNAALASGAVALNPDRWVSWYKESLAAGEPQDLPSAPSEEQSDKAELENHLLLSGMDAPVAYYDRADLHIPIHREAQDAALLADDLQSWQKLEQHIQQHLAVSAANAAQLAPRVPAADPSQPVPGPQTQPPASSPPPAPGQ